jgi:hypothetical protein
MKLHTDKTVCSSTSNNLYDTFSEIHASSTGWHSTVIFPYAHKALLWLFESALIYVAQKDGSKMNPKVTYQQACTIALPYFEWDKYPGSKLFEADLWDSNGIGTPKTDPKGNYYVTDGMFKDTRWVLKYAICFDPKNPDCDTSNVGKAGTSDRKLKRYFASSSAPSISPVPIVEALYKRANSADFTPWITGNAHNGIHGFVGFSMGRTRTAGDDPIFWLHHTNVDRFLHMWGDCNEYDKITNVDRDLKVPKHFNQTAQFTLDTPIRFTTSSGSDKPPPFLTVAKFPTSRQLWTMGTSSALGWNGLWYRYGYDRLASSALSSACAPGNTWTWVNQGTKPSSKKRSDCGDDLYDDLTSTFHKWTNEKGMSPQQAIEIMAWDDCVSHPVNITAYDRSVLRSFGTRISTLKRCCDSPDDFIDDDDDDMNDHMGHNHM